MFAKPKWPPRSHMQNQTARGTEIPLSLARPETRASRRLEVTSAAIHGAIPAIHSEYAEGISPPLAWTNIDGARSYALVMEDPDATSVKPFVHWVIWNIPASTTELPQGLQQQARVQAPAGLVQGRTSRGSVGYFSPRPPIGDPPHHYHFQIFALDTELDVPAGAERDKVLTAMQGHVIAAGEPIGTYEKVISAPNVGQ